MRATVISVLAVALALGSAPADAAAPASVGDAAKLRIAQTMIGAWKARNWRQVADLFTENGDLYSMMDKPVVGREAIFKRISALGAGIDAITLDVGHMGVIDGLVFIERVDRFVYKGKAGATPVVGVLAFEGDHISEWREYYDRHDLLTQMGVPPPP